MQKFLAAVAVATALLTGAASASPAAKHVLRAPAHHAHAHALKKTAHRHHRHHAMTKHAKAMKGGSLPAASTKGGGGS